MKKFIVLGVLVLLLSELQADDGFYTRAMCISRDGSFDPGEPAPFEPTIGFQTNPVRFSKKEKANTQIKKDRVALVGDGKPCEKSKITVQDNQVKKKSKRPGRYSA